MEINKNLKAGALLFLMLFFTLTPVDCPGEAEVPVYPLEKFNEGESDVSAEEVCGCTTECVGEILSDEESVIVSGEAFACFGWPPITVRVDGSGGGNFLTIGDALRHALAGEVILVAPGTYTENLVVDSQALTIRAESGNPEDTVIRAADPGAPVFHVTRRGWRSAGLLWRGRTGVMLLEKVSAFPSMGFRNVHFQMTCSETTHTPFFWKIRITAA